MVKNENEITFNIVLELGLDKYKTKIDSRNIHLYLANGDIVSMNYKIGRDYIKFKGELQEPIPMPNRPGVYTYKKTNKFVDEHDDFKVNINKDDSHIIKEAARQASTNSKYHWFLMATKMYLIQVGVVV